MGAVVVRYQTKPERSGENQAVFAELTEVQPDALRYASFRLADGVSFVHVASVETDDGVNPLTATSAFPEFLREIGDRVDEGPSASDAPGGGSYRCWPGHGEDGA